MQASVSDARRLLVVVCRVMADAGLPHGAQAFRATSLAPQITTTMLVHHSLCLSRDCQAGWPSRRALALVSGKGEGAGAHARTGVGCRSISGHHIGACDVVCSGCANEL